MKNMKIGYLIMVLALGASLMSGCSQKKASADVQNSYKDEYVFETFKITNIERGGKAIHGGILHSSSGVTGEGIFLDDTVYKKYKLKSKIKKGDVILVIYDKDDYENEIWDNIVDVKVLKEMN